MPRITKVYTAGFGVAGTLHLVTGNDFASLCGRSPKGIVTDTRLFPMCKRCATALRKIVEIDHAEALMMDTEDPLLVPDFDEEAVYAQAENSIQRAEDVLRKLASKQSAELEAEAPHASFPVAHGQRWLCVKGRDKGKLIELEYVAGRAPIWWYRNLNATRVRRVVGRITEAELHARWELRNCDHEEIIDDCAKCWCPFHGVAFGQCDCRAPKVAP